MIILKLGILFCLSTCTMVGYAQNLLNLNEWITESGGITSMAQDQLTSENNREWGIGPYGTQVVLWKASLSGDRNAHLSDVPKARLKHMVFI